MEEKAVAKKNLFNAETEVYDSNGAMEIGKKASLTYRSLIPIIEAHGKSVRLSNKSFCIGRDKSNAIIVADNRVSKFHAQVSFQKKSAYIKDTDSTNGTYINGRKLAPNKSRLLEDGDVIVVGNTEISFKG